METQTIIRVTLEAAGGRRWEAIGGGETVDAALDFAVASAPAGTRWRVVGWRDVFGD